MKKIEEKYTQLCMESSDINEHLPVLKKYAEECSHITEMGTRYVVSTWAFLFGNPKSMNCRTLLKYSNLQLGFVSSCLRGLQYCFEKSNCCSNTNSKIFSCDIFCKIWWCVIIKSDS